ncbi:MAG: hypothetical protein P8019_08340 [Gammaproteobacteria bacterium]
MLLYLLKIRPVLFFICVFIIVSLAHAADKKVQFNAGVWTGMQNVNEYGHTEYCSIYTKYTSGDVLAFNITDASSFFIILYNPKWELKENSITFVNIRIDNRIIGKYKAGVLEKQPHGFVINLGHKNNYILKMIRKGRTIKIGEGNDLIFKLTGTDYAIERLQSCHDFSSEKITRDRQPSIFHNPISQEQKT